MQLTFYTTQIVIILRTNHFPAQYKYINSVVFELFENKIHEMTVTFQALATPKFFYRVCIFNYYQFCQKTSIFILKIYSGYHDVTFFLQRWLKSVDYLILNYRFQVDINSVLSAFNLSQ